ncbi:DUF4412 domain-containing protein [Psychroserpens mesophilus]|uniref:DUF4412 domain-containing protein n=1 Tax=Psychroserpens mesophilus TaxID=325473 RepID=UPI003D6477D3
MKTKHTIRLTFYFAFFFCLCHISAQTKSNAELPKTYDFDYVYKLKITHKKNDAQLDYYLKKDAEYFGFDTSAMTEGNNNTKMFMVTDNSRGVNLMFMEMMGNKMLQKSSIHESNFMSENSSDDVTFKKIESKTILGYHCEGFEGESNDSKIRFYITDDVPLSFNKVWGMNQKTIPKGFNPSIMAKYAKNGLMMEMMYTDKKNDKNTMTMECIGLEKTDFSIDTTKYNSMMGTFGN